MRLQLKMSDCLEGSLYPEKTVLLSLTSLHKILQIYIFKFIWNSKSDKVKRSTLLQ